MTTVKTVTTVKILYKKKEEDSDSDENGDNDPSWL